MATKSDPIADALAAAALAAAGTKAPAVSQPGMPTAPPVLPAIGKPDAIPAPGEAAPAGDKVHVASEEAKATGATGDIKEETKAALDRQAHEDIATAAGEPDPRDARIETLERQVQLLGKIVGSLAQHHERTRAAVSFLNMMGEFVQTKAGGAGTGTYPGKIDDIPGIDDLPKMMAD